MSILVQESSGVKLIKLPIKGKAKYSVVTKEEKTKPLTFDKALTEFNKKIKL